MAAAAWTTHPFFIKEISGKGQGLLAARAIPRGTLIAAEEPILVLPDRMTPEELSMEVSAADPLALDVLLSLPGNNNSLHLTIASRMKHMMLISDEVDGLLGLFENICKANHSCRPNAERSWNEWLGRATLYAVHDIPAHEEITICYQVEDGSSISARDRLQEKFSFTCKCPACLRPAEEHEKSREVIRGYLAFVYDFQFRMTLDIDPLKLLEVIEENAKMAFLHGRAGDLAARFYDAFQVCALRGDRRSAISWAGLAREAIVLRQGEDTGEVNRMLRLCRDPSSWMDWAKLRYVKMRGPSESTTRMIQEDTSPVLLELVAPAPGRDAINEQKRPLTKSQKKREREKKKKNTSQE